MQRFIDSHGWLMVYRLPTYAPELNWWEGVWSHANRGLGNFAARGIDAPSSPPSQNPGWI